MNYYHFIYDTLPYLWAYINYCQDFKLVMSGKILPFVKESLELLGINNICIHNENNVYENVYLSNSLTFDNLPNDPPRKEIFEIYDILIKNALKLKTDIKTFEKVYISRRTHLNPKNENIGTNYTTRRKLVNEDNLVKKLKEKGFTEIFGENLSFTEKIVLFNNAKVVIGSIGGSITNCIFCNKDTKVLCLVNPGFLEKNKRMEFLFDKRFTLFEETSLIYMGNPENHLISQNMRVEIIHTKKIGEIWGVYENSFTVNFNYKNFNDTPELDYYTKNEFVLLDNGINSPWEVNVDKLISII